MANRSRLSLADENPEIASEANGWDPKDISASSGLIKSWKCKQGHIWEAKISNRTSNKQKLSKCPYCLGRKLIEGQNDLQTNFPEIAKDAYGWDPNKEFAHSNKVVNWRCTIGHIWREKISNRTLTRGDCPFCSNRKLLMGFNDLASLYPELALEADGWDPKEFKVNSNQIKSWKCKAGHNWKASIRRRVNGTGCKACLNKILVPGVNDLLSNYPDIASEADGWDPSLIVFGSGKKMKWKCKLNHQWTASVSRRTRDGTSCPVCTGLIVKQGFNDLMTTHPQLSKEAFEWDPRSLSYGSSKKVSWKCNEGHVWQAMINSRTRGRASNCPFCSNRKVLIGFNDLASTFPLLAKEAFEWDPKTVTKGSEVKKKWKCNEGHIWSTSILVRTRGSNCPSCTKFGYDPNLDGYLYFLEHQNWQMLQIGITNTPEVRMRIHKSLGWNIIEIRGPMEGRLAQQWETSILRMLKTKGADLANSNIAGKFDGYSEAWSVNTFRVKSIKELMDETEKFEKNP